MCGSEIRHCCRYFVHRFVRRCGSVTFVRLSFIICAAPNFVSDPDPLVLKAHTPGYYQSQIDLLKRQKKFTTKLVLEKPKLPPKKSEGDPAKGQPAGSSAQDLLKGQSDPVPQQSSDPTPSADPTPAADPVPSSGHHTRSRDPKSMKIRKAGSGTGVIIPPEYKKQRAYRGDASKYSLKNASQLRRLQDYLWFNGSLEACLTPKDGDCLYSALKWGIDFPQEYSADLLMRQVIVTICEHPDFFLRKLEIGIKGTYGGNRLTKEEYKKKEQDGTLEPDEIKDYSAPGPFSLVEYLEYIWKDGTWGDETFVVALSIQWHLASTVLNAEHLYEVRMRHDRPLSDVDLVVVHCGQNHYVGACKSILLFSIDFQGYFIFVRS